MPNVGPTFIAVIGSIVGLAMLAVLVSRNAQTPAVLTSGGQALANVISAAVAPVGNNAQASSFGAPTALGSFGSFLNLTGQ